MNSQKSEFGAESTHLIQRIEEERDKLSAKFEEKRRSLKDLERTTSICITSLEKEKAVLEEKIQSFESKLETETSSLRSEVAEKAKYIQEYQILAQQREAKVKEELNDKSLVIYELEKQVSDLQSRYDKEKALFDEQIKFLTEQKTQLTKIMSEN